MIGRREFLELLGGLVGQSVLSASPARFTSNERFVSSDLGLTFCKPENWLFIPPESLAREASDIGAAVDVSSLSPSVMNMSKDPWTSNPKRFTPGINIWSFDEGYFDSITAMAEYVESSHRMYRDFRVADRPAHTEIAGCPAVEFTTEFIYDTKGIDRPTAVRDRFVCIQHGERYLELALCDSPDTNRNEEDAFDEFLNSLVVAEPKSNVEQVSGGNGG